MADKLITPEVAALKEGAILYTFISMFLLSHVLGNKLFDVTDVLIKQK